MRLGLDLRDRPVDAVVADAMAADELGLWAVLVNSPRGMASLTAAEIALLTDHVHIAVVIGDDGGDHPLQWAEDLAVLDHLSERRIIAVVDAPHGPADLCRRLLHGQIVDGVALTPPPAQTAMTFWTLDQLPQQRLSGDLDTDRVSIDQARDEGLTHLFVDWPGELLMLARHLSSRALVADFPQIVANYADVIAPSDTENGKR